MRAAPPLAQAGLAQGDLVRNPSVLLCPVYVMIFALFTERPVAELFAGALPKAFCSDILIWNKVCLTLTKAACLLSVDRGGVGVRAVTLAPSLSGAHTLFFLPAFLLFFLI